MRHIECKTILSNASRTLIMLACMFVFPSLTAHGNELLGGGSREEAKGKAAAHAALDEKAGLPANPPELPDQASDRTRAALGKKPFGAKGDAARRAQDQGRQEVGEDARAARVDAADRAAQGAVASAVRNANADSHAAAGQARAAAAKAHAAQHPPMPIHPVHP